MKSVDISEIHVGDLFSEITHLKVTKIGKDVIEFQHLESKEKVSLSKTYVEDLLKTANQYRKEIIVNKEDSVWTDKTIQEALKRGDFTKDTLPEVGSVREGIRSIFEGVHSSQVFTVSFQKADKDKSAKKLKEEREKQISDALLEIEATKTAKKGVANKAMEVLKRIQDNPILPYEAGEERILTGWKVGFNSIDGKYNCIDSSLEEDNNIRPVNILTLNWLVFDGVKYTVKK